jgi:hypothetical protein
MMRAINLRAKLNKAVREGATFDEWVPIQPSDKAIDVDRIFVDQHHKHTEPLL